jgi:hypothetical protein
MERGVRFLAYASSQRQTRKFEGAVGRTGTLLLGDNLCAQQVALVSDSGAIVHREIAT